MLELIGLLLCIGITCWVIKCMGDWDGHDGEA